MSYPFTRLGPDVVAHSLCPFLETPDLVRFFSTNKKGAREQLDGIREIVERQLFSRIPVFGQAHYKRYWGLEITDQFEPNKIDIRILRTFLETYYGPNPVDAINPDLPRDKIRGVNTTCLIPTVIPETAMEEGRGFKFNLNLLGDVAEHSGIGNAAKCSYNSVTLLREYGEDAPQEAHLQIVLIDVIARNAYWGLQVKRLKDLNEQTGYGCEPRPDALSLTTATLAHHAVTGHRAFGDHTGLEGRYTVSRVKELVLGEQWDYRAEVGGFRAGIVDPLGGSAPAELRVHLSVRHFCGDKDIGVGIQRKFR